MPHLYAGTIFTTNSEILQIWPLHNTCVPFASLSSHTSPACAAAEDHHSPSPQEDRHHPAQPPSWGGGRLRLPRQPARVQVPATPSLGASARLVHGGSLCRALPLRHHLGSLLPGKDLCRVTGCLHGCTKSPNQRLHVALWAWCMVAAFAVLCPCGIIWARYFRARAPESGSGTGASESRLESCPVLHQESMTAAPGQPSCHMCLDAVHTRASRT